MGYYCGLCYGDLDESGHIWLVLYFSKVFHINEYY